MVADGSRIAVKTDATLKVRTLEDAELVLVNAAGLTGELASLRLLAELYSEEVIAAKT